MKHRQAGLTLIEVIIASVILVGLVGMTFLIMHAATSDYELNAVKLQMDDRLREVLNDMAKEMRMANLTYISKDTGPEVAVTPSDSATHDNFRFQFVGTSTFDLAAYADADPNRRFNKRIWYEWVVEPGGETAGNTTDDDLDGLNNEGIIRKTEQTWSNASGAYQWETDNVTTICRNVAEGGLVFKVPATNSGQIEVTLTLEKLDPATDTYDFSSGRVKTFQRTASTRVDLRN